MKIIRLASVLLACGLYSLSAVAQQKTGRILFIRSLNYVGSAVPFKVLIDDKVVCKLKNNHYSTHEVTPGEHTVAVQGTALSSHKPSRPVTIKVEDGKINYITLINGNQLYVQEVTASSAEALLKKTAETRDCKVK